MGLEGRSCADEWLQFFANIRVLFFYSRASTDFWCADFMAIILLKSATTNANANLVHVVAVTDVGVEESLE